MLPDITYNGTHFTVYHATGSCTSYSTPAAVAAAHFQGSDVVVDRCRALRAAWVPPRLLVGSAYELDRTTGVLYYGAQRSCFAGRPLDECLLLGLKSGGDAEALHAVFAAVLATHS